MELIETNTLNEMEAELLVNTPQKSFTPPYHRNSLHLTKIERSGNVLSIYNKWLANK